MSRTYFIEALVAVRRSSRFAVPSIFIAEMCFEIGIAIPFGAVTGPIGNAETESARAVKMNPTEKRMLNREQVAEFL